MRESNFVPLLSPCAHEKSYAQAKFHSSRGHRLQRDVHNPDASVCGDYDANLERSTRTTIGGSSAVYLVENRTRAAKLIEQDPTTLPARANIVYWPGQSAGIPTQIFTFALTSGIASVGA